MSFSILLSGITHVISEESFIEILFEAMVINLITALSIKSFAFSLYRDEGENYLRYRDDIEL